MKVGFSKNLYDKDGDIWDECILLHLDGDRTILKLANLHQLGEFISNLQKIKKEIKGNY